jgi:diguanylate cyclase (GGDEF)-like protein
LERDARTAKLLKALWAGAFAGLGLFLSHLAFGVPSEDWAISPHALYPLVYLCASGICFTRAVRVRSERLIWGMFGLAILANCAGWVYYHLALESRTSLPYPSAWDACWTVFYLAGFAALILMLRTRLHRISRNLWLDIVTAVLALAAVAAALFTTPIVTTTVASPAAVAITIAYVVADVMALSLVIGTFALSGWRPERRWLLIGVAWTIQVVADTVYFRDVMTVGYKIDSLLHPAWACVALLVAFAAWQPADRRPIRFVGWPVLAVPIGFTLVAMGVLIYGNFAPLHPVAVALGILALVSSLVGTLTAFLEQRNLEALAQRDPLTGLFNYRELHRRLDQLITDAQADEGGFAVLLMDIDGFKEVNDRRGHAEGDRVLREIADAITASKRRGIDVPARAGGDEFALLLPATDAEGAEATGRRVQQRVDALDEGIGVSFGVAQWPADGPTKEMLLLRADFAMYAAKSGDQVEVVEHDPDGEMPVRRGDGDADPGRSLRTPRPTPEDADRGQERAQLRAYAEAVRQSYTQGLERAQQLKQNYLATVLTLASAVEAKDEYTGGHINRVHHLGLLLARGVVPREADSPQMAYGFLLHDIGKLTVPDAILNKAGALTDEEWELMRRHPEEGVRILAPIPFLGRAIDVVRHHHERWDGCGYPAQLAGEQIPMWARIFAVVDSVDAMTSDRPYRDGLPLDVAVKELKEGAGTQFDPVCVAAFMRLEREKVERLIQASARARSLNNTGIDGAAATSVADGAERVAAAE